MLGNGNGRGIDSEEFVIFIGESTEIKGTVQFEGSGRIDGIVEGKIVVKGILIIGQGAQVSNEVEGDTLVIGGNVRGKIVGHKKVQLLKTAVVNADIETPSFSIEEGSQFNGNCRTSERASNALSSPSWEDKEKTHAGTAA